MTEKLNRVELARRMNTSRAALNRLLDPNEKGVTLQTLERAAVALGKRLEMRAIWLGRWVCFLPRAI